jgi:hypothetical protein
LKTIYAGIGWGVLKVGALLGIPYAKHKLEDR